MPTPSEITQAYQDNAGYDVNESLAECKLFIVACRNMLSLSKRSSRGGQLKAEHEFDTEAIKAQLDDAAEWYNQNKPASSENESGGMEVIGFDGRSDRRGF